MEEYYEDVNVWEDEYNPIMEFDDELGEETGRELWYVSSEWSDLEEMARDMIELYASGATKLYQHIWSRVDGDNGRMILVNGNHPCNIIDTCLCMEPWGTGEESDAEIYIEVQYEEERSPDGCA
jgi:hypothetical protein